MADPRNIGFEWGGQTFGGIVDSTIDCLGLNERRLGNHRVRVSEQTSSDLGQRAETPGDGRCTSRRACRDCSVTSCPQTSAFDIANAVWEDD